MDGLAILKKLPTDTLAHYYCAGMDFSAAFAAALAAAAAAATTTTKKLALDIREGTPPLVLGENTILHWALIHYN